MIAILVTTDPVKLSAVEALLREAGIESTVFDRAVGTLWTSVIPLRLMIADTEEARARRVLREAGWSGAEDGEWDYVENRGIRIDGTLA
jgi:hypothetical protein